jgi:hypothetical protein
LEGLLAGFAAKLDDTLGRPVRGIKEPMARPVGADEPMSDELREFVTDLRKLVTDEQRKSEHASAGAIAVLQQLATALADLEEDVAQLRPAEGRSHEDREELHHSLSTAFESFGNRATGVIRKTLGDSDRHLCDGILQLTGVVQEFRSVLASRKKGK